MSTQTPLQQPAKRGLARVVHRCDLPLYCPLEGGGWDAHPRVYLAVENAQDQKIRCPYCSTEYQLVD